MNSSLRQSTVVQPQRFPLSARDLLARGSLSIEKFATTRFAYGLAQLADSNHKVDRLVQANVLNTWRYYRRFFQLCDPDQRSKLQRSISVINLDLLSQALAAGRGAILASAHLGDFDLAGSWLSQILGTPVVVVVNRISPRPRQALFSHARHCAGITTRFDDEVRLKDLEGDLERGCIVVVMLDRRPRTAAIDVDFFGSAAVSSVAPWILSTRTGAPILTGAMKTLSFSSGRVAKLLAAYEARSLKALSIREGTQRLIADIENLIRWAPQQWHVPTQRNQLPWEDLRLSQALGAISAGSPPGNQ